MRPDLQPDRRPINPEYRVRAMTRVSTVPLPRSLPALLILLATTPALAVSPLPGLWKTHSVANGDVIDDFDCVTEDEIADFEAGNGFGNQELPPGCEATRTEGDKEAMTVHYRCDSAQQEGEGSMAYELESPKAFTMDMHYDGIILMTPNASSLPVKLDLKGRSEWVDGDCGDYADEDEDGDDE